MIAFTRDRIRIALDASVKSQKLVDEINNQTPTIWRGTALQFELGFFYGEQLITPTDYTSVTLTVREESDRLSAKLMEKVLGIGDAGFNAAMAEDQWKDGTAAHATIEFTSEETRVPLGGQVSKSFWMVVSAITTTGDRVTLGGGKLTIIEDGAEPDDDTPAVGASLIPPGSVYDGGGQFALNLTANKYHSWTKGANDTSLTNGGETLIATGNFVSAGATVTLNGTPGAVVTAVVRYPVYLTLDEADARYLNGAAKVVNDPGVMITLRSENKQYLRMLGVDNDGNPINLLQQIVP